MSEHTHGEYEISENQKRYYTPTTEEVRNSYASWSDTYPEFDRWLADHDRQKKSEGWERARQELRSIPYWYNKEDQYGEFDLQPLGTNETSERGAYMAVKQIMDANPYREEENSE